MSATNCSSIQTDFKKYLSYNFKIKNEDVIALFFGMQLISKEKVIKKKPIQIHFEFISH